MYRILEVCCLLVLGVCVCDCLPGLGVGTARAATCDNKCRVRVYFSKCNNSGECIKSSQPTCRFCHKIGNIGDMACDDSYEVAAGTCTEVGQATELYTYTCSALCSCEGMVFAEAPSGLMYGAGYGTLKQMLCNSLNSTR